MSAERSVALSDQLLADPSATHQAALAAVSDEQSAVRSVGVSALGWAEQLEVRMGHLTENAWAGKLDAASAIV